MIFVESPILFPSPSTTPSQAFSRNPTTSRYRKAMADWSPYELDYEWFWEIYPSEQDIQLFSDLPSDIVRLIFEKTVEDEPFPFQLLLVSRQVKNWLEPLMYRHLTFYSKTKLDRFYAEFERRLSSNNVDLYSHIKSFFVSTSRPSYTRVFALMQRMTGLRSVACWDDWGEAPFDALLEASLPGSPYTETFKHLRRTSLHAGQLWDHKITFEHSMFRSLQQLDIYFHPFADWESLCCLTSLTHLSVDLATDHSSLIQNPTELEFWVMRIINACPTSLRVAILGCIGDSNTDFDLMDADGDYLPPGWPPVEPLETAIPCGARMDPMYFQPSANGKRNPNYCFASRHYASIDPASLHLISRLALGQLDPRAVAGWVATTSPESHIFQDYMVYFVYPDNLLDWDGTRAGHKECWEVAEEIIERRRGLTYADLVYRMAMQGQT